MTTKNEATVPTERYEAEGKTLIVREFAPRVFSARITDQQRCRFGDRQQINEDIEHFQRTGNLPYEKQSWA